MKMNHIDQDKNPKTKRKKPSMSRVTLFHSAPTTLTQENAVFN
ncbi:hypothetical protein CHCC14600_4254 [Bacillus licheniformis]|nr:hypothetical protein CHCC14600_4254 [Bacillus licheniformis]